MDFLIPVLTAEEMRECDRETIASEPISSIELMERASSGIYRKLITKIDKNTCILILCGPGNNGGDGLCLARMLLQNHFNCKVVLFTFGKTQSTENQVNFSFIEKFRPDAIIRNPKLETVQWEDHDVIVDALLGSGLKNAVSGELQSLINTINHSGKRIYSIDSPTGLFDTLPQNGAGYVNATETFTIQTPYPSFFYAENKILFSTVDAGILHKTNREYYLSPEEPWKSEIINQFPRKPDFGTKHDSGHVLISGGNNGMFGAVAMAADQCIRSGAGLTTVLSPAGAVSYLSRYPKAMHLAKELIPETITDLALNRFTVLAVGPGLNSSSESVLFLRSLLEKWARPVLLDADALNLLAKNPDLWDIVLPGSIITPHSGEFERLFGATETGMEKKQAAVENAAKYGIYIVSKDKYTTLYCPDGEIYQNGSGGVWLSQGGSGDSLCGAIAAWWARTKNAKTAAMAGMYLTGMRDINS